jgi:hypothetical protein
VVVENVNQEKTLHKKTPKKEREKERQERRLLFTQMCKFQHRSKRNMGQEY